LRPRYAPGPRHSTAGRSSAAVLGCGEAGYRIVTGPPERIALATARQIAAGPAKRIAPMFLFGGPPCGPGIALACAPAPAAGAAGTDEPDPE
jgi:hypothetical protein